MTSASVRTNPQYLSVVLNLQGTGSRTRG